MSALKQVLCLATLVTAIGTSASAQSLGASLAVVKHAYPDAVAVRVGGDAALEMTDVDYAGLRWSKVDFVFDATGHLSHLSMDTTAAGYADVLKLATLQMNPPTTGANGVTQAAEDASDDMQVRVCEGDNGQIEMTFEPVSTLS